MADPQLSFLTPTPELVENLKLKKRILVLLQGTGNMAFCKTRYVDGKPGGPGCGREIFFIPLKSGIRRFNDDGSFHVCPEIKP